MKKGNIMRDVISSSQFTANVIKEYKKGLGDVVLVAITPRTTIELPAHLTQAEIDARIGSVVILGGLSLVNSLHAYTFASLKRKKLISTTPLNDALNALILALNASAAAFVLLFTKKFRILS